MGWSHFDRFRTCISVEAAADPAGCVLENDPWIPKDLGHQVYCDTRLLAAARNHGGGSWKGSREGIRYPIATKESA